MKLRELIKKRISELEKEVHDLLSKGLGPTNRTLKFAREALTHNRQMLFIIDHKLRGYTVEKAQNLYKASIQNEDF